MTGAVFAVSRSPTHAFSKDNREAVELVPGHGVRGDAHAGTTVQHRSRVARDPTQPNLRQVHLIGVELLDELVARGFAVTPGDLGENITTRGLDLLALPAGTRLALGPEAVIELTGLRNPCVQLDRFQTGLMSAVLARGAGGELIRRSGVMAVVLTGGSVAVGDRAAATLPPAPHRPLRSV